MEPGNDSFGRVSGYPAQHMIFLFSANLCVKQIYESGIWPAVTGLAHVDSILNI